MKVKILLADDHDMMRDGLRRLLEDLPDLEIAAEAGDGRTAVRMARDLAPDIVVMDIGMPELNGIEATRQIVADVAGAKVIILSMLSDKEFVSEALKAGAVGYVLKGCAFEELERAIRVVLSGQTYLSPRVASTMVSDYVSMSSADAAGSAAAPRLTPREKEVLQLLAEGKAIKEVAAALHLSHKTVEMHRRRLMDRLDIQSVAGLVKYAIREGLTSLDF